MALTSKYKSEFLANMSHELRTPLNSLLILSDQLSKNPEGNLTPKQTEFAKTIHSSGNDLLMLINDILDLSKIESGTVVVDVGEVHMDDLQNYVQRTFLHMAESKNVGFTVQLDSQLPRAILTDAKRLQQVLKNLLSNAFKFTHQGSVTLKIEPATGGWNLDNEDLNRASEVLAFSVTDTGIGIPADKQQIIFEAFQQADGSTSRKYGGTGLGLAISRELSRLLGGEIRLVSTPGKGSTFTLFLPRTYSPPRNVRRASSAVDGASIANAINAPAPAAQPSARSVTLGTHDSSSPPALRDDVDVDLPAPLVNEVGDDRFTIQPGDRVLLIVENDLGFAKFLLEAARESGFKGLVTSMGAAALAMTREYKPDAITLDIFLPDIEGWRVLDRLKNDIQTRHIPICVISTDESRSRALQKGAAAFVAKPIQSRDLIDALLDSLYEHLRASSQSATAQPRRLLVVEPDDQRRKELREELAIAGVELTFVETGRGAACALEEQTFDCVVINPSAADLVPAAIAEQLSHQCAFWHVPVIVYGPEPVSDYGDSPALRFQDSWKGFADFAALHRAASPRRLLDYCTLFLHRPVNALSESQRQILQELHESDKLLAGRKVLIVDDDVRNIFALATVLEEHDMVISSADNGRTAVQMLQDNADIDIVLMDIMMPEMDGIDTMREIRKHPHLRNLPIIAVTAKAMKGDREKCIEAGAWDYLAKPVETEQLLSVLRAWLHR